MAKLEYAPNGRLIFTKEMKQEYTILAPQMLPIHFAFIEKIFNMNGFKLKVLKTTGREIVDEGLRCVHNDTCYPALLVIGQMIHALKSGEYDLNKTALLISQTGGGCRASNYINLLRKALKKNNMEHVPVVSLSLSGLEKNPGFDLNVKILYQLITAIIYGDLLMWLGNQTRPYENKKGDTDRLIEKWTNRIVDCGFNMAKFKKDAVKIAKSFEQIPYTPAKKVKVGIVGEIYIKFAPLGNNNLEEFLHNEGVEVVIPGLLDFILYHVSDAALYKFSLGKVMGNSILKKIMTGVQNNMISAINQTRFNAPSKFEETRANVAPFVSYAVRMGEGWLLTAEMIELINSGVNNIVCAQPFGCLPNHIVGKGMVRKIRNVYNFANIVAIDYDPGATKVNQENRIKLMLSTAKEALK